MDQFKFTQVRDLLDTMADWRVFALSEDGYECLREYADRRIDHDRTSTAAGLDRESMRSDVGVGAD